MNGLNNIRFVSPESSCIHPRSRVCYNPYLKKNVCYHYPCGKCYNCQASFKEFWRIRLYFSMLYSKYSPAHGFIYDTLTLSPQSLPSFSAFDYFTGEAVFDEGTLSNYPAILEIIDHYEGRVPCLMKETLSYFLKKGRERYNSYYRKQIKAGKMSRCTAKWFAALEYGPKWARPHVHIAVFNVSRGDWVRFWAKPWRRQMGFTKTKFIDMRGPSLTTSEHCSRISRYISKYLLKGSYENVLVKAGIVPPAWRVVSNGIGEEYLKYDAANLDWLRKDIKFNWGNTIPVDSNSNGELYQDTVSYCFEHFSKLTPLQVNSLKLYVENGYKFALPRYYRDRILCTHSKGLAGCAIKVALSQDASEHCFEEILQYASDCNFFPRHTGEGLRVLLLNDLRAFNMAAFRFDAHKNLEKVRRSEWNRIQTLNFCRRLSHKPQKGDLGLLL